MHGPESETYSQRLGKRPRREEAAADVEETHGGVNAFDLERTLKIQPKQHRNIAPDHPERRQQTQQDVLPRTRRRSCSRSRGLGGRGCHLRVRRPTGRTPENRWGFLKTLDADITLRAAYPGDVGICVRTTRTGYRRVYFRWLHSGNGPNVSQQQGVGAGPHRGRGSACEKPPLAPLRRHVSITVLNAGCLQVAHRLRGQGRGGREPP